MLINRDNYETIFLMYVDKELSTAERKIVEEFLQANEDLREEMNVLQSAVLPPEDEVFVPKTRLYKNETPVESVQESLLLLLDNELSPTTRDSLLKQIGDNEQVKEEWSLLQKTVLNANDKESFPDKQSLYKKPARVIPVGFLRSAAAIVIGLGIFAGITLYDDDNVIADVATIPSGKSIVKPVETTVINQTISNSDLVTAKKDAVQPSITEGHNVVTGSKDKKGMVKKDLVRESAVNASEVVKKSEINVTRQDKAPEQKIIQPINNNPDMVVSQSPVQEELPTELITDTDVGQAKNNIARLAVNEEDPDRILNIEEDKITRSKIGGILRQVKRVVERNTKIKTSNGLRIGGFEIALK